MSPRPRPALALVAIAALVMLLHGWVIDRVAARALPPPETAVAAAPVMLAALRLDAPPAAAPAAAAAAAVEPSPEARPARPSMPRRSPLPKPVDEGRSAEPGVETPSIPPPPPIAAREPEITLVAATSPPEAPPAASGEAAPVYRTRIPAAAQVSYRLSRGMLAGTGELDWRPDAGSYQLRLEGRLPLIGTLITQTSRGRFDAAGLAPERYTDRRLRRGEQAANFERALGRISFSGQNPELPLSPGVQDRLSVMLQLAAIVNAWGKTPAVGEPLRIAVVGARGDLHLWSLRFEGPQAIDTPAGRVAALRFLREPDSAQDTRAEFWLDPARQHLPVKVVLTDGKGEPLELLRMN